ncbi:Capsule polysaccharide biosynthesis protein [Thiorhodovibrio winogradskyi]|uniref:Capsule polysaccharide biosynthesis protein n=2 Tax=Thiorhodovibrio winogradskyi TaxID=77007 RepID=A0ABZ0SFL7_9GAMM
MVAGAPEHAAAVDLPPMPKTIAFIDPGMRLTPYLCAAVGELPAGVHPAFFALRPKPRSILRRCGHALAPAPRLWPVARAARPQAQRPDPDIDRDALLAGLRLARDRDAVTRASADYRRLLHSLRAFLDHRAPDGLFCWNGSGLAAGLAAQLARVNGIPMAFGENGYLPGTMQLDPKGVNAASSFGPDHRRLERILGLSWSAREYATLDAVLQAYRDGKRFTPAVSRPRALGASPLAYLEQALIDWREREPGRRVNRLVPKTPPPLPKRYVLFPLQVRQDSQLTVHSPLYGNQLDEVITGLVEALADIAPELVLVVKLHPADRDKTDYDPLIRRFGQVFWLDGGDIRALLPAAQAVVTINSTVGIEAMIFNRPVVVLGRAYYGFDGLVHLVTRRDQLTDALQRALNQEPNPETNHDYLAFLYFKALTRAHPRDYSTMSMQTFCARLAEIFGLADEGSRC